MEGGDSHFVPNAILVHAVNEIISLRNWVRRDQNSVVEKSVMELTYNAAARSCDAFAT